jgi:hypothetical protein
MRRQTELHVARMKAAKAANAPKILVDPGDATRALVPLQDGLSAIIDAIDTDLVSGRSWHLTFNKKGTHKAVVTTIMVNRRVRTAKLHRVILGEPRGLVDHRDGDVLNNRRNNLRACDAIENGQNKHRSTRMQRGSLKGVAEMPSGRFWAKIQVNKRAKSLGTYETEELAARMYDAAAVQFFGDFARPNFLDGVMLGPLRWHQQKLSYNTLIEFRGDARKLRDWAKHLGITAKALWARLKAGWSVERALTEPFHADRSLRRAVAA